MKNQYFGDVGDFGKYGLLSKVNQLGISVGVNWYYTEDDVNTSSDGKFIEYLNDKQEFYNCDKQLYEYIRRFIIEGNRNIRNIEEYSSFSNIIFYKELLKIDWYHALSEVSRQKRIKIREHWYEKSKKKLYDCDIIFCDPDNGIQTLNTNKSKKDSIKYIFIDEIMGYLELGKSLIIYNHRDRSKEIDYINRINRLATLTRDTDIEVLRFKRYSVRDYIFIMQKDQSDMLRKAIEDMASDRYWKKLFEVYPIKKLN